MVGAINTDKGIDFFFLLTSRRNILVTKWSVTMNENNFDPINSNNIIITAVERPLLDNHAGASWEHT